MAISYESLYAGLPSLARAGTRASRGAALTPQEEESLISNIGGTALGWAGTVGNILDTPSAIIRALLAGENPLPGIFNPQERVGGRDLLERMGILDENTAGLDWGDVAGFGTEVLLDPLTYLTMGGSALSKAGKVATAAGLAKNVGKAAGHGVGPRVGRMTTTLDDLLTSPAAREAAETAAKAHGTTVAELSGQKLGGLFGVGLPFKESSLLGGTGRTAQKIAGGMDRAGRALRYGNIPGTSLSPGRAWHRLFNSSTLDTGSEAGQRLAADVFEGQTEAGQRASAVTGENLQDLIDSGAELPVAGGERTVKAAASTPEAAEALRRIGEGIDAAPGELAKMFGRQWDEFDALISEAREWGLKGGELVDAAARYWPRYLSQVSGGGRTATVASVFDPSELARKAWLKELPEGTSTIQQIAKDKKFNKMIADGASTKRLGTYIKKKYGVLDLETTFDDGTTTTMRASRRIAAWMKNKLTKEQREVGVFGNHPMMDAYVRMRTGHEAIETARRALTHLADGEFMDLAHRTSTRSDTVRLADVLKDIGFEKKGGLNKYLELMAESKGEILNLDARSLKRAINAAAEIPVPADLAEDMTRLMKGFTGPEGASAIMKLIDPVSNLFKAGVTSAWPAFHMRNLTSGQMQNWFGGMFSLSSVRAAKHILEGGTMDGAAKIPKVRQMLVREGRSLTDEAGTDVIRRLAHQNNLVPRYVGETGSIVGRDLPAASGLDDLMGNFPGGIAGGKPSKVGLETLKKYAGLTDDTTLVRSPRVRGVGGAVKSTFGPMAAGEDVGYLVEGLNRLSPFIQQLTKGVDPGYAASKIKAAQVDYAGRAYTKFEREFMTRLFPFYKFFRGVTPYTVRQLWEHPGGKMAQSIRATNLSGSQGGLMPDYVGSSAAIPIPEGFPLIGPGEGGDERYLTGLGLMHEDPLSFAGSGPGLEALSRLNPIIKGPLEAITRQSFFQKGPRGGRPMDDLDPVTGRILGNITGQEEPVRYPGMNVLDPILANSPASRLLTTIRTATETEKRKSALSKAVNLGTGVRLTDVSQAAKQSKLRQRISDLMRDLPGSRVFKQVYIPEDELAAMSPEERRAALAYKALLGRMRKKTK